MTIYEREISRQNHGKKRQIENKDKYLGGIWTKSSEVCDRLHSDKNRRDNKSPSTFEEILAEEKNLSCWGYQTTDSRNVNKLDIMAHICSPSSQDANAREVWAQGQPGRHSETMSQNKNKNRAKHHHHNNNKQGLALLLRGKDLPC